MKPSRFFGALLCALTLCTLTLLPALAKSGVEAFTYTYTDDDPIVDTQTVFLTAFNTEKDIEIIGERASWYFFYDNVHLSTNTWSPFSTAVTVKRTDNTHLTSVLGDIPAYHIDLRDGDSYPGPAELTLPVSDVTEDGTFHLFRYAEDPSGKPVLTPIVKNLALDENGAFTVTVTAAFDFLLVSATVSDDALASFHVIEPLNGVSSPLSSESLPFTVLFLIIGLVLVLLCIYLITVKVIKARRAKNK